MIVAISGMISSSGWWAGRRLRLISTTQTTALCPDPDHPPTTTGDCIPGLITNGPATLARLDRLQRPAAVVFVSYQGQPEDHDATVWFAWPRRQRHPPQDWTLTALDYSGSQDTRGSS